ncbi:MAG: Ig domain-containing protein, partial [Oscillospiraceae bacterium]|nr:Ig domain-containing protein [Oscillospiraceae bacterium]
EVWNMSRGGLYGLCLTVDDQGNFYILGTSEYEKTELWVSYESSYGTLFKKSMSLDVQMDNLQSMTWNHNDGVLYWAQFWPTSIYTFDTALYTIDPAAGTYEKVGTLTGETCAMFAPLTQETIDSNEIYTNVPTMDADIVGKPVLRKDVINMNVGAKDQLVFDFDPWYTDHKNVIWTSSDEDVVTIDENGNIVAVGKGSAVITVTAADDLSLFDSCVVNVTELTLKIQGIVTSQGAGVGAAYGSYIYEFALDKGIESYTGFETITAPEHLNFGLDLATSVYARGYIWACEFGNTGMIYKIDPATGEVVDSLMPIDGDMIFGLTYNEKLDTFTGIMNMYLFVNLELTKEEQDKMMGSYDEETNQYTYHRINMLEYLIAAGGNFVTGEYGQGASSEVVMCGITTITDSYRYEDTGLDFLGQPTVDIVNYNATQTLVVLDNVGRLWYIDQINGLRKSGGSGTVTYTSETDPDTNITYFGNYKRDGLIEMDNGDGTYTVFHIRSIEETPLTQMFLDGTMPRITYHFSDIEFGGYTADGAPIFALSLYDYWNNGTTNELYLYTGKVTQFDEEQNADVVVVEDKLYYLGTTGQYNIIASIHLFEMLGG